MTHDYTRRVGILHAEIMAPEDAPDWVADRGVLWNKVEACEKRKDSQVAREIEAALPRELSEADQLALVRRFVSEEAVSRGMVADFAIHERPASDGGTNPHCHIMLTMRDISGDGFGPKRRDWNDTELVETWRKHWEICCNDALEAAGEDARVDHRSFEERGIMLEPSIHLGKEAYHGSERGLPVERAERQLSMVERSLAPFSQQIEAEGHINQEMTPEPAENWWERVSSYSQRVSETVQDWYGRARDTWRSWTERQEEERPAQGPVMER